MRQPGSHEVCTDVTGGRSGSEACVDDSKGDDGDGGDVAALNAALHSQSGSQPAAPAPGQLVCTADEPAYARWHAASSYNVSGVLQLSNGSLPLPMPWQTRDAHAPHSCPLEPFLAVSWRGIWHAHMVFARQLL